MSLHRFFVDVRLDLREDTSDRQTVELSHDALGHLRAVRLERGERVVFVDEEGASFETTFLALEGDAVSVCDVHRADLELPYDVTLFQGVSKGDRMDLVMRAGCELGLSGIVPIRTARCVVRLDERKAAARAQRWRKIARPAAEQSGRQTVPDIPCPLSFPEALERARGLDVVLCPYEDATSGSVASARAGVDPSARVGLFVGPEGGFALDEVEALSGLGARIVTLGPTILRTETAGVVASALVIYELGGLGRAR